MLNKQEQDRIRAEEIYRQEIRESLKASSTSGAFLPRAYRFLQSNLGIWFLTTVVVGLVSVAVDKWVERSRLSAESQSVRMALFSEATYRINRIDTLNTSSVSRLTSLDGTELWSNEYINHLARLRETLATGWRTFHSYGLVGSPYDLAITVPGSSGTGPTPKANAAYSALGVPDLISLLAEYCPGFDHRDVELIRKAGTAFADPNDYPFTRFATESYEANTARGQKNRPDLTSALTQTKTALDSIQNLTVRAKDIIGRCAG